MSASAHHLKGFIPVLEEKEGAPLGDVAGPKFAHGIQIPLIEGIIESLHRNGKQMQKKMPWRPPKLLLPDSPPMQQ